jgi:hypothetical protein
LFNESKKFNERTKLFGINTAQLYDNRHNPELYMHFLFCLHEYLYVEAKILHSISYIILSPFTLAPSMQRNDSR